LREGGTGDPRHRAISREVSAGFRRVTRDAGIRLAIAVARSRMADASTNVNGSVSRTPQMRCSTAPALPLASAHPMRTPATASAMPERNGAHSLSCRGIERHANPELALALHYRVRDRSVDSDCREEQCEGAKRAGDQGGISPAHLRRCNLYPGRAGNPAPRRTRERQRIRTRREHLPARRCGPLREFRRRI
jgi:hypothetical protein